MLYVRLYYRGCRNIIMVREYDSETYPHITAEIMEMDLYINIKKRLSKNILQKLYKTNKVRVTLIYYNKYKQRIMKRREILDKLKKYKPWIKNDRLETPQILIYEP